MTTSTLASPPPKDTACATTSGRHTARVDTIHTICPGVISIELCPASPEQHLPPFTAGAHIDLHLPNGLVRSYSLHNAPCTTNRYAIGVLHDSASRGGSRWVHEQLHAGDQITISAPRNHFALDEAQGQASVFVAGGIGVTPILSMLRRLMQLGKTAHVIYCARSRSSAPFLDDLARLASASLTLHTHFDDEADGPPKLQDLLAAHRKDAHFYCCGPAPMLASFEASCAALGLDHMHLERFKAEASTRPQPALSGLCTVELRQSGLSLELPKNQPPLQALLDAGVDIEFSCEEGVCGACETRIIEGEAVHRDSVLSAAQKTAQKSMMVCVSRCRSDRMVLDL